MSVLYYIDIIQNNVLYALILKTTLLLTLFVILFLIKWVLKKILVLIMLTIYIIILLLVTDIKIIIWTFVWLLFAFLVLLIFFFLKENEAKLIIISKFKKNDIHKAHKLSYHINPTLKSYVTRSDKNEDNTVIVDDDILSLYTQASREQYKYEIFSNVKWTLVKIKSFFTKHKYIINYIIIDIKIILIILVAYNFYFLIEVIKNINMLKLLFKFN